MTNNPFKDFTDRELKDELKRREARQLELKPPLPKHPKDRQWKSVSGLCRSYVESAWSLGFDHQGSLEHHIFEAAIEAVYGNGIFGKLNKRNHDIQRKND